jgi:hypothetical protein
MSYGYVRVSIHERLWSRVDHSDGPDACWPWSGPVTWQGYGHIHYITKNPRTVHSVALELTSGYRPEGMYALHTCDNPPCCNPDHLYWGTHDQNMLDKAKRGRAFRMPGETHHQAKLTNEQVAEIRRRYIPRHPVHGAAAMAREFGVTVSPVQLLLQGKNWRHTL